MISDPYQDLLTKLTDVKKTQNNWYLIASVIDRIKKIDPGPPQPAKRLKDASDASGCSLNSIWRMLAVKEFIDAIRQESGVLEGVDVNTLSFQSLEVVKRLYQIDAAEGEKKLLAVAERQITFRALKAFYTRVVEEHADIASEYQLAKIELRGFLGAAYKAVTAEADKLIVGGGNFKFEKPRGYQLPADLIGYRKYSYQGPVIAFEFVMLRDPENPRQILETTLHRILFTSSFVDRFWVVFASNTGTERVRYFSRALDMLERTSIGIAILPWGVKMPLSSTPEKLAILREPTGNPNPDFRDQRPKIEDIRTPLIVPQHELIHS